MGNFDDSYRKGWDDLGFYYEHDDDLKRWTFVGDIQGLNRFSEILKGYTNELNNQGLSEHMHLGPQEYLKVITWNTPYIGNDGIYGSFDDLIRLADIFSTKLSKGQDFVIDADYSKSNKAHLQVIIKENGFDPSTFDTSINKTDQVSPI